MALTEITSKGIKDSDIATADIADDAITQAKIADESIDEARIQISNAGTNGQFLQKQSGNTGGLTWATVSTTDSSKMPLAGGTFTGDVTFDNQSNAGRDIVWDESDDALEFKDNTAAVFGDGNDLYIWHNGTENFIEGPQHLIVKTTDAAKKIYLQSDAGIDISDVGVNEYQAKFINDGAVELYYDGTKKLETISDGITVSSSSPATVKIEDTGGYQSYIQMRGNDMEIRGSSGQIEFYQGNADGASSSEKFRISSHGGVTFNGDTAAANCLNDYEEGNFTPTLEGTSTAGSFSFTSDYGTGRYIKIGNLVTCTMYTGNVSISGTSGIARISNLPFTSAAGNRLHNAFVVTHATCFNHDCCGGYVNPGATYGYFMRGFQSVLATEWNSGGYLMFTISYQTD